MIITRSLKAIAEAGDDSAKPSSLLDLAKSGMKLLTLALLAGGLAGLGGMMLALLLHWVQHLAYGYGLGGIIGPETFLQGVSDASPYRRLTVVALCGMVAGIGWAGLSRFGRPLVSINKAIAHEPALMPFSETVLHGLLQIVTVALGSPLGREVAPREYGALLTQRLCKGLDCTTDQLRILTACGAGAGLAAVYDVPFAATVFIMEVLLKRVGATVCLAALLSCFVAARVAAFGLGTETQYSLPMTIAQNSLLVLASITGPLIGACGLLFKRWTDRCSSRAASGFRQMIYSLIAFSSVGALSMALPQLLGNGKGPAELAFSDDLTISLALILIATKIVSITIVLRAGARGGLLTPGFSLGSLLAIIVGYLWNLVLPVVDLSAVAVVRAAAFLSCSMAMPLTAILITIEFTGASANLVPSVLLAVLTASGMRLAIDRRELRIV
ncbi:chloride channel protein [Rhizobium sp. WYJ-E13]|uniref:chloride channel protein n=1 Tax=Rhizobium sp. WYJ-E13 TaxID=2849093 RepID=UPI001C1EE6C7|nr:chloride channel protein [Rhizobium sp. WYJ-E13]QWW72557.1 chloride channel protein [Rhizobium sp. WYJ-E13]